MGFMFVPEKWAAFSPSGPRKGRYLTPLSRLSQVSRPPVEPLLLALALALLPLALCPRPSILTSEHPPATDLKTTCSFSLPVGRARSRSSSDVLLLVLLLVARGVPLRPLLHLAPRFTF